MTTSTPILILVPGFPADESDLSCLPAVQNYVEALCRRRPRGAVEVIAFQYPYDCRSYQWRCVRVHALGGGNASLAKPRIWMRAARAGRRFVAGRPQGVIHSFWLGECALVGSYLAHHHAWKHVVSIGGQEVRRRTIYSTLLRRGTFSLTAGSGQAAEAARDRLHREAVAVIPLGLDADRVTSAALKPPVEDRAIDILAVGSLTPVKRMEDVIDVAARLVERRPRLAVEIIGEGPERARLLRRISDAGVADHVVMRGRLPREEVLRLMRRSKVLLHPSEYESQGYVFLEALAFGMFVVCRDVGFRPQSRSVALAMDADEMADVVERYLDDPFPPQPVRVPTAEESVDAFMRLYAG